MVYQAARIRWLTAGMPSVPPPRVLGLAIGVGAIAGGLVIALMGSLVHYVGLTYSGLVVAGLGVVVAIVGAVGFALHGSVRSDPAHRDDDSYEDR